MITNRRETIDRRRVAYNLLSDMIDRRKIPDRRLGGLDVRDVRLSEKAFFGIFAKFVIKK